MENKIILIEDDEEIRSMVKDYLSSPLAHRVKISRRSATAKGLREKSPACFFKPSALSVK